MPAGIPGETNRGFACIIEPASLTPLGTTGHPTTYGVPLVVDQTGGNVGNMRTIAAGDATTAIYGLYVRPYPTGGSQDPLGVSTPPNDGPCDVLRSGYMSVLLSGSTAAVKGGQVYVWTAAASGTHIVGGFESTNPSGSGVLLTNGFFMGPADANGITEISLKVG
jgi:hypothetical protein